MINRLIFSLVSLLITGNLYAAINLDGDSADWVVIMTGAQFDVAGDQRASNPELELIGGVDLPLLYAQYDDSGTTDTADDAIAFRARVSGLKTSDYSGGYLFIGFDLDLDNDLDFYLSVSGKSADGGIVAWETGDDLNVSPSTTSIQNPTQIEVMDPAAGTGNFAFVPVDAATDPTSDPDSDSKNAVDYFVNFKVSFTDFKTQAENKSGITVTPTTAIQYTLATSTQANAYNSDVGGYDNKTGDLSLGYSAVGAFTPPLSISNVFPEITSNGGADTAEIVIYEGFTAVTVVTATDADGDTVIFSLSDEVPVPAANVDQAKFSIDTDSGALVFNAEPYTSAPEDADGNNDYQLIVIADDGNDGTDTQAITVTVKNDSDSDADGIPDSVECPVYPACPDTDGDGTPDYLDLDSDDDGMPDIDEGTGDSDGDGIPDYVDVGNTGDSDGDGIPDSVECPVYPGCTDTDGDTTPDYMETDSDNDGIPDAVEAGSDPSAPVDTDNDGAPDYQDTDSDNDGIPDAVEAGLNPSNPIDSDGDGTPDYLDTDSDGDGIPDAVEAGSDPAAPIDTDNDGIPDYLDTDSDNDGIPDAVEAGLDASNPIDSDGDGIPDYLDLDSDNDGIADADEGTGDNDGDGIPDYVDIDVNVDVDGTNDSDSDGIPDGVECPVYPDCPDTDSDGIPDYLDTDADGDGIPDAVEGVIDTDGDGIPDYQDTDSDGDGVLDAVEGTLDSDGDGIPDYVDVEGTDDSDGDGVVDIDECNNYPNCADSNNDGTPDYMDASVRPYDPDASINTAVNGVGGNGPGLLLLMVTVLMLRKKNIQKQQKGCA